MIKQKLLYLISVFLFATILLAADFSNNKNSDPTAAKSKASTSTSASDEENFNKMMNVLTHKRCMNCHPSDNIPKQGEDSHPHYFGMARGAGNVGFEATNCNTCHQKENNDFSGVPGAPEWSLAPASMKWEGLSRIEIAQSMLDKERNGGRSHEEVMEHLTEHALVLWAWNPGIDAAGNPRETPPVPKEEYIKVVKEWFENGAVIPGE
jgi:cytochrome c553